MYGSALNQRVLCMEFIDGVKITNKFALKVMGVPVAAAVNTVVQAMSDQIFLHGYGLLQICRYIHSSITYTYVCTSCSQLRAL